MDRLYKYKIKLMLSKKNHEYTPYGDKYCTLSVPASYGRIKCVISDLNNVMLKDVNTNKYYDKDMITLSLICKPSAILSLKHGLWVAFDGCVDNIIVRRSHPIIFTKHIGGKKWLI